MAISLAYFLVTCAQERAQQAQIRQPSAYAFALTDGRKAIINPPPVFIDPDSLCWSIYAHQLAERGEWRIRTSPVGDAPAGRPMLWAHLYLWWILLLAKIASIFEHVSLSHGIDSAIFFSNPLAFLIFSGAWYWVVRRFAGALAAAIGVLFLAASPAIGGDFGWWHPDHHGFHLAAMLGGWTAAVLGSKALLADDAISGRRLLTAAGILGGLGLWIGATQQASILAIIGAFGLITACFISADRLEAWERAWMRWALAAALTSLAGFFIEFYPDLENARLEVNHPAFAAACLGGGLLICGVARKRSGRAAAAYLCGGAALALVAPIMILTAPIEAYSLRDPVVFRCHQMISEFESILLVLPGRDFIREYGAKILLLPAGLWTLWRVRRTAALAAPIAFVFAGLLAYATLVFLQFRWSSFLAAGFVLLAIMIAHRDTRAIQPPRWIHGLLIASIVIVVAQMAADSFVRIRDFGEMRPDLARSIGTRDIALALRSMSRDENAVVVGEPPLAPALYAYGRIGAVTALYWEAAAGIHTAADILSSSDNNAAENLVRQRGVTHVIIDASPEPVVNAVWTALGTRDPKVYKSSLAWRLAQPNPISPDWLELEHEEKFLGRQALTRFYRVKPVTSERGSAISQDH